MEFKQNLADKIRATHHRANNDPNYTTFLKHFGEFKIAKVEAEEVSTQTFLLRELSEMRSRLDRLLIRDAARSDRLIKLRPRDADQAEKNLVDIIGMIRNLPGFKDADIGVSEDGTIVVRTTPDNSRLHSAKLLRMADELGYEVDAKIASSSSPWTYFQ